MYPQQKPMRVEKITPVYLRLVYENILDKHLVTLMRNRRCSADKIEDFRAWRNMMKIITHATCVHFNVPERSRIRLAPFTTKR